jgi:hypothetical protein
MTKFSVFYNFSRITSYLLIASFITMTIMIDGFIPKLFGVFVLTLAIGYLCLVECLKDDNLSLWIPTIPFIITVMLTVVIIRL